MATFVDQVVIHATAGNGGHGCASVHSEKFKPLGGPDGGNGGRGGDVILVAEPGTPSLLEYHHSPHRRATNGVPGQGGHRNGANGSDVVLPVPVGTVICRRRRGPGRPAGGRGVGRHRPRRAWRPGQRSTCLRAAQGARIRAARRARRGGHGHPRAQDRGRHRSGRVPQRGQVLVDRGDVLGPAQDRRLPVHHARAEPRGGDRRVHRVHRRRRPRTHPGRVAGQGPGPGVPAPRRALRRPGPRPGLRHARAGSGPDERPRRDRGRARRVRRAGRSADGSWSLNKVDVPEGRELAEMVRADLEARGLPVFLVSAVSHEGLRALSFAMGRIVSEQRAATATPVAERIVIQPKAVDDAGYEVVREGEAFRVRGGRPERWIRQTDFSNDEAVGYLADRLARLGVEEELVSSVRSRATRSASVPRTTPWCSTGSRPCAGPDPDRGGRTSASWLPRRASTAVPGRSSRRGRTLKPPGRPTRWTRAPRPIAGARPWLCRVSLPAATRHRCPTGMLVRPRMRGRLGPDGCDVGATRLGP